jgi:hypothetical protein
VTLLVCSCLAASNGQYIDEDLKIYRIDGMFDGTKSINCRRCATNLSSSG